jgi:hypothetical protein
MTVGDLWVDYSFSRPSPDTIRKAGYVGVARYLTHLPSGKALSSVEAKALHDAGLAITLVWETTAGRAGAGSAAGAADARSANKLADALGVPKDVVIFYAVDFDADPSDVAPYFHGAKSAGGRPVGVYGSFRVVKSIIAGPADYGWQTLAWSGGKLLSSANLYQRGHATVAHPVSGTDENVLLHTFPTWNPEADMPTAKEIADAVWSADEVPNSRNEANPTISARNALGRIDRDVAALKDAVANLHVGVPVVGGVDLDALADKVADKLAARLAQ